MNFTYGFSNVCELVLSKLKRFSDAKRIPNSDEYKEKINKYRNKK